MSNVFFSFKEYALVPEHIETRSLYSPHNPDMEYGKVEMWVDMFAMDGHIPPKPIAITPRKPDKYQLRVIVRNVEDTDLIYVLFAMVAKRYLIVSLI